MPPSGHSCTANVIDALTVSALTVVLFTHSAIGAVSVPWISP